jgi:hypothetical protein
MQIKLFDIDVNNKNIVIPTEHCYTITCLHDVIKYYGGDAGRVLAYIYYLYELDPEKNIYANTPEEEREENIIREVLDGINVIDIPCVEKAKECVQRLFYTLPGYRMYLAYKYMWDKMADALEREYPDFSKEGNMSNIKGHFADYKKMKESLDMALKDYQTEINSGKITKRGGGEIADDLDEHDDLD